MPPMQSVPAVAGVLRRAVAGLAVMGLAAGLSAAPAEGSVTVRPVTDAMLAHPDDADWLSWRRTYDSSGYSPLAAITRDNVGALALVWTRGIADGMSESTPLVHDGVMFMPESTDVIEAFDGADGTLKWTYRRDEPADLSAVLGSYFMKRSIAIYEDHIIGTSADDFLYALDVRDGKLAWQQELLDFRKYPGLQSSGPIVANGIAISGRRCEPKGGPDACVLIASNARTGRELWRLRTTPRPREPGDDSWGGVPDADRRHVGNWMPPSYDPATRMLFVGTSVTSPGPKYLLAGNDKKYLYHNSTLAIDAGTGRIVWYYQHLVDHWDMDHPFERLLVDTVVAPDPKSVPWINPRLRSGERRRVVTGIPGKTGIVYTLDRATGEFLWARPTVFQNIVSSIDAATGAVTVNPATLFTEKGQRRLVCPSAYGGRNWPAGAYSPATGFMYMPLQNTCDHVTAILDKPDPASIYGVVRDTFIAPGASSLGTVQAIDAATGRLMWSAEDAGGTLSLLATGGGLVFGGDAHGFFRAYDAATGKLLWEVNLGAPVAGVPIAYAAGNREFVAVSTGSGVVTAGLNRLTPAVRPGSANAVFVFALPIPPPLRDPRPSVQ